MYTEIQINKRKNGTRYLSFKSKRDGGWESSGTYANLYFIDSYIVLTNIMDKPYKVLNSITELCRYIYSETGCELMGIDNL